MATLALTAVGTAVGTYVGGPLGGKIGGAIGATIGGVIDQKILGPGSQAREGPRLDELRLQTSTEGAPIPRVFGGFRIGGQVIWATRFRERATAQRQGGKGLLGGGATSTTYAYSLSFAVALCVGPIDGVNQAWANGEPVDLASLPATIHTGTDDQAPDPTIAAIEGDAPAYRGVAYIVFDDLDLEPYGNRVPQFTFEVQRRPRPPAEHALNANLADLARGVALIPASGEFAYATTPVRRENAEGEYVTENQHASDDEANIVVALDQLEQKLPNVDTVSLVVSWFGDDLRLGQATVRPKVEDADRTTDPVSWAAGGITRGDALAVSRAADGVSPVYGGAPSDASIREALIDLGARDMRRVFYPFILMDVPPGNGLPDPHGGSEQAAFPWRGRIVSADDGTAQAAADVAAFFGTAQPSDFGAWDGATIPYTGPAEWSYRRMILHYAHLCASIDGGGCEAFLIGSELRGITRTRDDAGGYPAVAALRQLAADVKMILPNALVSYAADWTEYFGHQTPDGGFVFHLDPLWADANIDFIGVDNYMPLSDWRDGGGGIDGQTYASIYDQAYLRSNVEGGEGYDWYYASTADRDSQTRTPISDAAHGEHWLYRYKDLRGWWSNPHHDRPGGVRSAAATAWVPQSKPIWFTELGVPAVDKGSNQPNVFYDPKSAESALPYYSSGARDDAIQRAALAAMLAYWSDAANNPTSTVYNGPMIAIDGISLWTWDARPYPAYPNRSDVWSDGANYARGHWLNGRVEAASVAEIVAELCADADETRIDVDDLSDLALGYAVTGTLSPRDAIQPLALAFGFDAVETGGRVVFTPRGAAALTAAATVTPADLVGDAERLRAQETDLPAQVRVRYAQADADYQTGSVTARLPGGAATARVDETSLAVALSYGQAVTTAERFLHESWIGRESITCALPPSRFGLTPGDALALVEAGRTALYRIDRIEDAEARQIEATRIEPGVYRTTPAPDRVAPVAVTARPPAPIAFEILDLPSLDGSTDPAPFLAAYAKPWPGRVAAYRAAGSDGFVLSGIAETPAALGALLEPLPAASPHIRQRASTRMRLSGGALEAHSLTDLANGAGPVAFKTPSGAWEVAQIGTAVLQDDGSYRITDILRGQRGTDWLIADLPTGTRVVLLNSALTRLDVGDGEYGLSRTWRIGPASVDVAHEVYRSQTVVASGAANRPFAPADLYAARSGDDVIILWRRRARRGGDGWDVEPPHVDPTLRFIVTVRQDDAVIHTAETSTETYTYAAAPTGVLAVSVAQIGDRWGVGPAASVTVP